MNQVGIVQIVNPIMTDGTKMKPYTLADIEAALTRARLRRALLTNPFAVDTRYEYNGGTVHRFSAQTLRYEVDGKVVKSFRGTWANVAAKMTIYLQLETEQQQRERLERLAESMEDVA